MLESHAGRKLNWSVTLQAQDLVESLEWLNTPIPLRLRTIIFTSNAPVSTRLKALIVSVCLVMAPLSDVSLHRLGFRADWWSDCGSVNRGLPVAVHVAA